MKYPYTIFQSEAEGHRFWIAKSTLLKGCVGQGDTQEDAILELQENEAAWLETALDVGIPIPEIPTDTISNYSGKLTLRLSPSVHRRAAQLAKAEGISLNQYINDAVVSHNSQLATIV